MKLYKRETLMLPLSRSGTASLDGLPGALCELHTMTMPNASAAHALPQNAHNTRAHPVRLFYASSSTSHNHAGSRKR